MTTELLTSIVDRGEIGFERLTLGGTPYLVTGAQRPNGGPAFYFLFDAAETEAAIAQLGQALLGDYLLPFEIVSVLLLVVMIGAAYLAKARRRESEATTAASAKMRAWS
jgi:hypothetical protein